MKFNRVLAVAAIAVPFIGSVAVWAAPTTSASPNSIVAVSVDDIKENLIENYRYLVASQVKCDGNFDGPNYICNSSTPGQRRILGSWDSYIIPVQMKIPTLKFNDSNVFVTSNTLLPLFQIQFADKDLEAERLRVISEAMKSINIYRRGSAFAFWPQVNPLLPGQAPVISPLNMSSLIVSSQLDFIKRIGSTFHIDLFPKNGRVMEKNVDSKNKDLGISSEMSVPNDADDTAVGIATNFYWNREKNSNSDLATYLMMTRDFAQYTDTFANRADRHYQDFNRECSLWVGAQKTEADRQNLFKDKNFLTKCSLDDPREKWRYDAYTDTYSGGFLSWLYDEREPVYAHPEQGVALPGQNSVDCDINANILYTLSLTGMKNDPSLRGPYENACRLMTSVILGDQDHLRLSASGRKMDKDETAVWKYCGLFYPVHMTFPYLLSRALAEANACQDLNPQDQGRFDLAMKTLTQDMFTEQDQVTPQKKAGEWLEKVNSSVSFSTAMGAVALLNLKSIYENKFSVSQDEWKTRIDEATLSVVAHNERGLAPDKTTPVTASPAGAFFGGGFTDEAGLWMSRPLATSVSMELMSKYLLAYDETGGQAGGHSTGHTSILRISGSRLELNRHQIQVKAVASDFEATSIPPKIPAGVIPNIPKTSDGLQKPTLHVLTTSPVAAGGYVGFRANGDVKEAIVGVELTVGKNYNGSFQTSGEQVAYYKVKLDSAVGYDVTRGDVNEYEINVRFLGIAAHANDLFSDEMGLLPIEVIHEPDASSQSVYLTYAELHSPVKQIGGDTFLNLDLTAKLIGFYHRANENSLNAGDFKIGFTVKRDRLSFSASADSALGVTRTDGPTAGDESYVSSHRNYGLEGKIQFELTKNQKLSILARHASRGDEELCGTGDVCLPENKISVQYTYSAGSGH